MGSLIECCFHGLWNRDDHRFGNLIMAHNSHVLSLVLVLAFDCVPPFFLCVFLSFCLSFFLWFSCFLPFFFLFFSFLFVSFFFFLSCFLSFSLSSSLSAENPSSDALKSRFSTAVQHDNMTTLTWKIKNKKKQVNILNDTACVKRKLKATLSRVEIPHPIAASSLVLAETLLKIPRVASVVKT